MMLKNVILDMIWKVKKFQLNVKIYAIPIELERFLNTFLVLLNS